MHKALRAYEKSIVLALLMLAVFLSAIELAIILFQQIMTPPKSLLDVHEMLEVFGFFLMVLIGMELLETIKAYLQEDRVHAKVVFLVTLVAVSRKVIILALGIGYFLVRRTLYLHATDKAPPTSE